MNTEKRYFRLPKRNLPVIGEADVIVVGASLGGISAAIRAAKEGAKVFVVGYMPYPGEDLCGHYKYLFEYECPDCAHPLLDAIFPKDSIRTPFTVKKALENAMLENDIDFLYSSYVTEVLMDKENEPAGVVIVNRSGRQVIKGKTLIDATFEAYAARIAGVPFRTDREEEREEFFFITVGNAYGEGEGRRRLPFSPKQNGKDKPVYEHVFKYPVGDRSYDRICEIEQDIRGRVWDPDQVDAADTLFHIPLFQLEGQRSCEDGSFVPAEAFMPKKQDRLFVLGPCADIHKKAVPELLKPLNLILSGDKVGFLAAQAAKNCKAFPDPAEKDEADDSFTLGTLSETGSFVRPKFQKTVKVNYALVPVLGSYEVAVVGGGTAGANAAIGAARQGVKTLVIEYLHGLGGTQTMGRIGIYWDGYREGFTKEIDKGVKEMAPCDHPRQLHGDDRFPFDWKTEWYRREIRKAGGRIWFGVFGAGAYTEDGKVKGVLVATPEGLGVVLADIVIDSTGSGDIAIAAGSEYEYTDEKLFAVQGAGLPPVNLGDYYNNTDWAFIDDSDVFDVTSVYVSAKAKFKDVYDLGKLPQTRERRRIVAEHMVSVLDVINKRRYKDTISYHKSSFDTHGYTVDPFFTLLPPEKRHTIYDADVPLRSLMPKGLDNILVTGLGAGAHRDAMPVIRMQPCLQNQGYSVGYLCALAVKSGCSVREADIKKVQAHLVEKKILPERVLSDQDHFPFTEEQMEEAVKTLPNNFTGLNVLLTDPKKAEELLLKACSEEEKNEARIVYARVLCMLGNKSFVHLVADEVEKYEDWDQGWDYTGMGQFGPCMSRLDSLIMALGQTKDEKTLPVILKKAKLLTPKSEFSHFRAVAEACEAIGSEKAADVLSRLLDMEGIAGHHVRTLKEAFGRALPSTVDVSLRNKVLREIFLARALYRCGDDSRRKGEQILRNYSNDWNGHYFRHTASILKKEGKDA
ncbi:MAG: FAD-dependent oxidoreductase [Clostridia bacterium]|jgi:hypothetical protein